MHKGIANCSMDFSTPALRQVFEEAMENSNEPVPDAMASPSGRDRTSGRPEYPDGRRHGAPAAKTTNRMG